MEENKEIEAPKKSVKKNYLYNLIYQLFLLIVPILVTPYLSRILLSDGIGKYSYTYSYVTYFTLFAALGFGYYAQRLIARDRTDKHRRSIDFWEIVIARLVPFALAFIVYWILIGVNAYGSTYNNLMVLHSLNLVAVIFDVTFFLQGQEEFGKIAVRNVIIKLISIACIFIFVKVYDDLWKYVLIQSATVLISNISLWVYIPKMVTHVKISELHPLRHFIPTLILFLPTIATNVYTMLDKTLIGLITGNDSETGNYNNAEKLVKMSLTVITSLGTVFIPRNSALIQEGKINELKKNINNVCKFVLFIGIPMCLGIAVVASNLIPWYLGSEYGEENIQSVIKLMYILCPIIIIIGLSNVFGLQLLIPAGKDFKFTLSVILGSVINLILNIILIPHFGAIGAAIGTLVAELIVTIVMLIFVRKFVNLLKVLLTSYKFIIAGIIMFVACFFLSRSLSSSILHSVMIVGCGIITYGIVLLILRERPKILGKETRH